MTNPENAPTGPLTGIRVVDMSSVLMGPYATQILADYGADVIKIEDADGDLLRLAGSTRNPKMGSLYLQCNRNKRSVVLDAKSKEGYDALMTLCADADVFVSNIRPAAMRRLKLEYADVKARNPSIIYVSLVGYGRGGPYEGKPAFDDLMQGISGISALIARAQGSKPQYVPVNMADKIAGITAAHAILAALVCKERTGQGQSVEVPMFEIMAQFVLCDHLGGYSFEPPLGPIGYNRLLSPDRRPYETQDGFLALVVYTNEHWKQFFDLIGQPEEYSRHAIFHDHAVRASRYEEVHRFLVAELKKRTTREWELGLESHDIPWAPINSIESLVADEHLQAVNLVRTIEHPSEGTVRLVASPVIFSETPSTIYRHPPRLGEHTAEVLDEIAAAQAAPVDVI